eukprot:2656056-Lingulodinium_polyedra.AAC.1
MRYCHVCASCQSSPGQAPAKATYVNAMCSGQARASRSLGQATNQNTLLPFIIIRRKHQRRRARGGRRGKPQH